MKKLYETSAFQKIKSESFLFLFYLSVCNRIETNLELLKNTEYFFKKGDYTTNLRKSNCTKLWISRTLSYQTKYLAHFATTMKLQENIVPFVSLKSEGDKVRDQIVMYKSNETSREKGMVRKWFLQELYIGNCGGGRRKTSRWSNKKAGVMLIFQH